MLSVGSGFGRPTRASTPAVINYLKPNVQYAPKQPQVQPRLKVSFITLNGFLSHYHY